MKKVISVFLALMMCLSLAIPAFAVDTTGDISYNKPGETIDWGPKEPDMCLTLPTEIVVYDDRSGNYTVGATEVRNAGKAKATITDVQVSPSQGWSLSDWDATRGNVPVDAKTFSMRVFDAAVGSTGHVADTTAFPSLQKDASADMGVSFWMAPQRNIDGRPQVADVVVTAEFEDLSVYAILYDDGELVFQEGDTPEEGRTVTATCEGVETATGQPWSFWRSSIKTVTFKCDVAPVSTAIWFNYCENLTAINNIGNLNTSKVTNMGSMFSRCSGLTSLDVSGFDTRNVTDMSGMFYNCRSLTSLDVSGFDTSNVTNMYDMFASCSKLTTLDVSSFDTSNVTDMGGMFSGCFRATSLDVSGFDTRNVTNMDRMFYNCLDLTSLDVSGFDTSDVTNMNSMFYSCSGLTSLDVTGFDTRNVTNMGSMFSRCSGLTSLDVSGFDTSNVTNMGGMFASCSGLTSLDVTGFDTRNITNMNSMFYSCSKLTTLDVSSFDTSNVTDMGGMFPGNGMFASCSKLTTIYATDSFVTSNVTTDSTYMFYGSYKLVGGNGTANNGAHMDKEYARIDADGTPGYFTAAPSVALLDATMDAAMLDGMAAPGMDAVPELPAGDGTYEVDPDTEVVEVPETPIFDVEPETPEVPTVPSEPEGPAGDQVETPDEGATEPEPGEEPAEGPDDVPASPDVEPSQDPEPAAKPDEEDPAPDARNQDGDGEGVPDTETPEDAQPPDTDGEVASDAPEEPEQD